jgi:DNA (cytosine-5)-methyltransferase 1
VFLVSDFAGERTDEILALTESLRGHPAPRREAGKDIAPTISARTKGGGGLGTDFDLDGGLIFSAPVAPTVTGGAPFSRAGDERAECGPLICRAGVAANAETLVDQSPTLISHRSQSGPLIFRPRIGRNGRGYAAPGEPVPALNGADAGATSDMRQCVAFPAQMSATQHAGESDVAPCLSVSHEVAIAGATVRRLTPTECERLQGFPDDWTAERCELTSDGNRWIAGETEPQSDSPRYKQMGNAVTVNVAEWIGQRIQGAMQ